MADSNTTNPFVLPGLGQPPSDASGNPLLASMDMMRQAWAGLAGSGGLGQMMPMSPSMNVEDLERRIAELRSVESWLRMNLSMLDSTIQGMEVQRATINTLKSFVGKMSAMDPAASAVTGGVSPLEAAAAPFNEAAQSASKAWWNLLQEQFNNLAAATAASMPGGEQPAAQAKPKSRSEPKPKPARKKAAPRKVASSSSVQP